MRRLRRLLRRQSGYSMVELITVMVILGTIMAGLTTAFVQGSTAELDANRRVQAQIQATGAFDKLRRDVHCASTTNAATGTAVSTITLSGCTCTPKPPDPVTPVPIAVTWYTNAGNLYRSAATNPSRPTCDSPAKLYVESLTSPSPFTYWPSVADTSLAKVHVDVKVNVNPSKTLDTFELIDDIVLRNSTR